MNLDFILTYLVPLLIPALLGLAVMPVMQILKKFSTYLDARPAWMKQLVVALLALLATKGSSLIGIAIPEDILGMNGDAVTVVLTALVAFVVHKLQKPAVVA